MWNSVLTIFMVEFKKNFCVFAVQYPNLVALMGLPLDNTLKTVKYNAINFNISAVTSMLSENLHEKLRTWRGDSPKW